jgi:hypothetical protein
VALSRIGEAQPAAARTKTAASENQNATTMILDHMVSVPSPSVGVAAIRRVEGITITTWARLPQTSSATPRASMWPRAGNFCSTPAVVATALGTAVSWACGAT